MNNPKVDVAILTSDEIRFELYGDYQLNGEGEIFNGKFKAQLIDGKIHIFSDEGDLQINEFEGFYPTDVEGDTFVVRNVVIGIDFHWEQKKNQRYKGAIKFVIEENKITAVNQVSIEDYLISVISSEMSATSSLELLKAHAIISRSWLITQIKRRNQKEREEPKSKQFIEKDDEIIRWYDREDHLKYDVCADDHCQRYQGITKLFAHNAQDAVEFTHGMVLTYEDEICDARFSKACGGISESFENVWEPVEHPYLSSIIDYKYPPDEIDPDLRIESNAVKWIRSAPPAFCNTSDKATLSQFLVDYDRETKDFYRWTVQYNQEELSDLIKRKTGMDFGEILDLVPIERGYSGRLIKMKIVGAKKTLTIGKELEIRKVLSESHLYSSAIVIEKKDIVNGIPQRFDIIGAGWGHGVGLCQIGAAVMSEEGYLFDEILAHYFKNTMIKKIY